VLRPSFLAAPGAVRGEERGVNLARPPGAPAPGAPEAPSTRLFRLMATTVQEARPQPVTRYKIRTGMFAWMLHRLTGVALVGYLVIHVWGLRSITNPDAYNALIAGYHAPIFKLGEFLLLGAVAWHALNGLRIVLIDFLGWSPNQKRLFWTLGFVALVLFAVGGYPSIAALVAHFGS